MRTRIIKIGLGFLLGLLACLPLSAQKPAKDVQQAGEQFFIISSVNMSKNQLVLKHPTEVTELMLVNHETTCLNEKGKSFECQNLRAGDTVFVTSRPSGKDAPRSAVRIRMGPMTIEEIHRKYVDYQ